ncbi:MAG: glycosyltransferase family 4 protein [Bryobacteraceae bacterium]|nr:glycosyltransferase family 4 protein [Bryobacteraceae bacterium]
MRIAIDARHLRDFGIGTYIRNLVRSIAALHPAEEFVLAMGAGDAGELPDLPANFQTAVFPYTDRQLMNDVTFPAFLSRLGADLYHIPLNSVPIFMPKPYVVTVHDLSSLLFPDRSEVRSALHELRYKRGLERASRVIAVSGATRRDVENVLGIPSSRLRQIYNAPDPVFREGTPADREMARGILDRYSIQYPFILYAGTIRPQKNIPRLVEAFAVLRGELEGHAEFGDLRLIIIGDEISKHPEARRAMIQSRIANSVRFLGFVPIETLRVLYGAAKLFAFPSLYEGFGLPPLEAMACGTPVVTSSVSSLPEVVGDAAVIVNPENVFDIARGLREALLDEDLRAELKQRGRRQLLRFSWEETARQVLETYRDARRKQ